jgi:hypothetical protein
MCTSACRVAAVNVGLFYLVKCGRHGAEVRGGLTRAFLATERVRRVGGAGGRHRRDPCAASAGGHEQPRAVLLVVVARPRRR